MESKPRERSPAPAAAAAPPDAGLSVSSGPSEGGAALSDAVAGIARKRKERADKGKSRGRRGAPEPEAVEEAPTVTKGDLASALRGVWSVAGVVAAWLGYDADDLTDEEVDDGARAWLPIARRFAWLASAAMWIAGPAWLATMIMRKVRARKVAVQGPSLAPAPLPEKKPVSVP